MIRRETVMIKNSLDIAADTVEMTLHNSYLSKNAIPGQFLHILVEGHTLRRPISIADVNNEEETITIIFKKLGSGTKCLSAYEIGMTLDVLGPNGNGFLLESKDSTLLLVGGGVGVPPLHYLGKKASEKGVEVVSILGFQNKESVFYEEKFKQFGKTIVVTNDGSYGERGYVTDFVQTIGPFDSYYSCGPAPMLHALTKKLEGHRGYISLEERMTCGIGACFACVIPTSDQLSYRKICADGPVFSAKEVVL
ncbi:dihydroorotate dehydrogenase electron transfer subunit [Ornithinibacillus halophilus]|uniref:Dihydroorotate dehydrogenase B (NAD(+)), electron transfer subunit n=1 Tax=Ornithinibacillus halophilus TaxID=930117 RepID=A0A1M5C5K4_9BACI|nr:dihydroorotate dehydrogenase electron transfer subunit [Ornithinibacillus halophilus]SHF50038.1 dihydroorotate oxidase B, electron transfer subunit [Ornithinibacillus halophilus]